MAKVEYAKANICGNDMGRPAWHYLLLVDDDDIIDQFRDQTQGTNAGKHTINWNNYGQILKSGWGEEPPNDVKEWMEKITVQAKQ